MRRGLGRGRAMIGIGAVLAIIGLVLPWWTAFGGDSGLPTQTGNGFDGAGIAVFVASIGLLALLVLPYASNSGSSSLDRPIVFALLGGVAVAGLVIQLVQLWTGGSLDPWPLDQGPGMWLCILGVVLIAWGVGEVVSEGVPKPPVRPMR
jgi:hypothetical protein